MIRLLTENIGLKLLSLAVASLLWLATVGEPDSTMAVVVPVHYHNIPKDMEVSSSFVDSAYVEVRGSSGRLSGESLSKAVVVIDLAPETRPGERTFSILEGNVNLPPAVEFVRAIPSQIRVRLEPRVSRDVPVLVRYGSNIPEGYRIAGQQVVPATVRITGPESRVQAIDRVQTDPLEFGPEGTDQRTFRVHAYAGDDHVRLEKPDLMINVKVALEKAR